MFCEGWGVLYPNFQLFQKIICAPFFKRIVQGTEDGIEILVGQSLVKL